MTDRVVASRYAQALVGLVSDLKELDRFDEDIEFIKDLLNKDDVFRKFFLSPRVLPKNKKDLIKNVFSDKLSPEVINMLLLIIDKHRENIIFEFAQRFDELSDELRGVETGKVITAVPIEDENFNLLEQKVQKFSGRKITLLREVDPAIIGGVILWLGNKVIDGSIRYRLETLKKDLLELKTSLQH